jgi:hypothetical protein
MQLANIAPLALPLAFQAQAPTLQHMLLELPQGKYSPIGRRPSVPAEQSPVVRQLLQQTFV